jgi:hypothetical protein
MSIHGFVRTDEAMKQLPLLFVLMSRCSKDDYIAVLQKTRAILGEDISVEEFVLDFEAGKFVGQTTYKFICLVLIFYVKLHDLS